MTDGVMSRGLHIIIIITEKESFVVYETNFEHEQTNNNSYTKAIKLY